MDQKSFFKLITSVQKLDVLTRNFVNKVLERNDFFIHSENSLFSMINHEIVSIRILRLKEIKSKRKCWYNNIYFTK